MGKGKWKVGWSGQWERKFYHVEDESGQIIAGCGEHKANAQLIAQAPRMAEWLERLVKQGGWVYQKDLDEAKEIISKLEAK